MQEALQKMAGAVPDVLRIVAPGRERNPGALPDDVLRGFMCLEGGEGAQDPRDQSGAEPVGFALV